MKEITIYEYQLKEIIDALRLTSNIYNCQSKETCFDRIVTTAKAYADNALNDKKDEIVKYV
jgi:hypothetical protein